MGVRAMTIVLLEDLTERARALEERISTMQVRL
jgi:hypothetical protein